MAMEPSSSGSQRGSLPRENGTSSGSNEYSNNYSDSNSNTVANGTESNHPQTTNTNGSARSFSFVQNQANDKSPTDEKPKVRLPLPFSLPVLLTPRLLVRWNPAAQTQGLSTLPTKKSTYRLSFREGPPPRKNEKIRRLLNTPTQVPRTPPEIRIRKLHPRRLHARPRRCARADAQTAGGE